MIWDFFDSPLGRVVLLSLLVLVINVGVGVVAAYTSRRISRRLLLALVTVIPTILVTNALVSQFSGLGIFGVLVLSSIITPLVWYGSYRLANFVFRKVCELDYSRIDTYFEERMTSTIEEFKTMLSQTMFNTLKDTKIILTNTTKPITKDITDFLASINKAKTSIAANTDKMEQAASTITQETKSMSDGLYKKTDEVLKKINEDNKDIGLLSRLLGEGRLMRAQFNTIIGNLEMLLENQKTIMASLPGIPKDDDKADADKAKRNTSDHKNEIKARMAAFKLQLDLSTEKGVPDTLSKTIDGESTLVAAIAIRQLSLSLGGTRQRRIGKSTVLKQWEFAREFQMPLAVHITNSKNGRTELWVVPVDRLDEWEGDTTSAQLISDDQAAIDDLECWYNEAIEELGGEL